ncbi:MULTISPECIES: MCE family protein [Mycobacteriaceae]|uniref:Mammalian cell entry protein n=1 Tax=Mycolicibacterium neoaurum VKM Ac-1815D TaxID=700508 RepID=V5X799_MYCNE|nr:MULTISPECIES: MCE family protein [Mycobacteriaceae]AHC23668.1 mammalian cell entry protein [Mycolicibacterium neoaurum VKM Ac-1815D]AMO04350.1 mammalian cell entry protein [Mycolicibacterium neoaurum]AXK77367.1 MCE family protein [Mycolicibacterium neoaurum]KJQ48910.1 mammalian cell entry protein [Mycolicibacterium neoaurum]KUM07464.1 mammalian cell entry protein [Mycolicibacterium neoaurum]
MRSRRTGLKVAIFTAVMLLVLAGLVVTFGQFRFGSNNTFRAEFASVSRLKTGQDVRIAGIAVGSVKNIAIEGDHAIVTFTVDKRQQLYTSTRAAIRYLNLTGDRYLEILAGPGDLVKLPAGATIPRSNTVPALDLDALLGGLRPVLKGLDAAKLNTVSNAIIELLQGKGGTLSTVLATTADFTRTIASRDQLIDQTIDNLTTVLAAADHRSTELNTSIDQLQQLVTTLSKGRDPIVDAVEPLAAAQRDLTDVLSTARRPLQGVLENAGPLATALDDRKQEVNATIEPLAEDYLRLSALGAYGSFFNIYFCSVKIKINGPAGSDILLPAVKPPSSNNGRCDFVK